MVNVDILVLFFILRKKLLYYVSFFKNFIYLFIFREKGREGEREGEKHQCVVASCTPPAGDLAYNSGMCPDCELNQWGFGSQAGAQSTEPHQPVHKFYLYVLYIL